MECGQGFAATDVLAMIPSSMRLAVLVPCFNEEAAVATGLPIFRKALPAAKIYVYDNNSSDGTAAVAREAGCGGCAANAARGKGHVVAAHVRRYRRRHLRAG